MYLYLGAREFIGIIPAREKNTAKNPYDRLFHTEILSWIPLTQDALSLLSPTSKSLK